MSGESANAVQSIEEAFTAMRESVLVHINGPEDDKPPCEACDNAARALALVVLEKLRPAIDVGCMTCEVDSDDQCAYHATLAQLEALGR
jgi:hypothetical protein